MERLAQLCVVCLDASTPGGWARNGNRCPYCNATVEQNARYGILTSPALKNCSACGASVDPALPQWRWNGKNWEHQCPGAHPQCGHFPAERAV